MNTTCLDRLISGGWKDTAVFKTGDASLGTRSSTIITMAIAIVKRAELLGFHGIHDGWYSALGIYDVVP